MGATTNAILSAMYSTSPYEGFDYQSYPRDLQGGTPTAIMREAFNAANPSIIVEVGTWKGTTACFWASLFRESGRDGAVICVDTWLGGIEHIGNAEAKWSIEKHRKHGYPTLYYQFLANVMHEGLADYVVPFPSTSVTAARWLAKNGIRTELAFIDASHEEIDVYIDLVAYWPLVVAGGIMCGDDWNPGWPGVINAVQRFAGEQNLEVQTNRNTWALQKPEQNPAANPS